MKAISGSAHTPVTNLKAFSESRKLHSTPPFFGKDNRRFPVSQEGFEAIPGFKPFRRDRKLRSSLRNISELTYGRRERERLQIGALPAPTQQTEVSDTTIFPWRAIAALKITIPNNNETFLGTGWFIGPNTVITAAHAVFPRENGIYTGWASDIEVVPGLNGDENAAPFGTFHSQSFFCPTGWQAEADMRLDYGAILLGEAVGAEVGTLGYATYSDDDLNQSLVNLAGYPVAPPNASTPGTLWYAAGDVSNVDDSFVYYSLSTEPGESGSCVYRNIADQCYAAAIHTAATEQIDRGLRITAPIYDNLQQWSNMKPQGTP
jgi:glutamyl endopeptidase